MAMSRIPSSGRATLALALVAAGLAACGSGAPNGVSKEKLDAAISDAIGDPNSCLLIAEQTTGKVVYRYNSHEACDRKLPACDKPGVRTLAQLLADTVRDGQRRELSCNTAADASRGVSWLSAPVPGKPYIYAAVMEGTRTFPARMMADRLEPRFKDAGF
jgi:hypothetical protein